MGKKKKSKKMHSNEAFLNQVANNMQSSSDPNGSYTGRPKNENETPVQDADDL